MVQKIDNLVLEHLKAMRGEFAEVKASLRDIKARLSSMESYIATLHGDQARMGLGADELAARIARLEIHAGIISAE